MDITLNGETRTTAAATLAALWVEEIDPPDPATRRGFAIALNGEVVRAPAWDRTTLADGDRVEIIRAVAGG